MNLHSPVSTIPGFVYMKCCGVLSHQQQGGRLDGVGTCRGSLMRLRSSP